MSDLPPSYEAATGRNDKAKSGAASSSAPNKSSTLSPTSSGIPAAHRRSMEDESRELPKGWVRQYDTQHKHQFFVDTNQSPPRSIWHHPYDDEEYLATLSKDERERVHSIHNDSTGPTHMDMVMADSTDDEGDDHHSQKRGQIGAPAGTGDAKAQPKGLKKFGRQWKDKITNTTHEQRVQQRKEQAEADRKLYEQHQAFRMALQRAIETGEPQLVGKDKDGKEVYVEPPQPQYGGAYGGGYGGYGGGYSSGARAVNPYSSGIYANPDARFIRPQYAYDRPYGYGYGGGLGGPLLGGLAGGLLLGSLLTPF